MTRVVPNAARRFGCAAALLALAGLASTAAAPESRYRQYSKKFAKTSDRARVVAATYLGGPGTEWLVAGGFQSDGTIVVAGTALGPSLEIGSEQPKVLGTDGPAPSAPKRKPKREKGKVVKDRKGNTIYEPFAWDHESATAFVVRLSPDLQSIKSVSRFPWKAGGLTSAAVDERGHIYLTGPARTSISAVGGKQEELAPKKAGRKKGRCDQVYLCKLSPDASKVLWLRTLKGPSDAPELTLLEKGRVALRSGDLRTFSAEGKQESVTVLPDGIDLTMAVNPRDGTFARGGERTWDTGREPYRAPVLNIHKADGKLRYELYSWDGPLVGLDNLRLVSNSAVRLVRFDEDGNLVLYGWAEGGNSVLFREPNDVRTTSKKMAGLGLSAAGADEVSCAYLIRVEPKNYKIIGGTLWLAYLDNTDKPNSTWIDSLGLGGDGSICFAGRSAWGLIRTGNALAKGDPRGTYVAVLSKDCTSLRFSSTMLSCGQTDVGRGARWGIVQGTVNGKPMALFLSSADLGEDGDTPAPSVKPVQSKFGGGYSDGYLLLLDLSTGK
jgi:hypothetical protein